MLVVLVLDELLVHVVGLDTLRTKPIDGVRHTNDREEWGGRTSVKAAERNRVGTVQRNLQCVGRRSPQRRASV